MQGRSGAINSFPCLHTDTLPLIPTQDRILSDFNLTRKHLETANTRNQQLFTQLTATQKVPHLRGATTSRGLDNNNNTKHTRHWRAQKLRETEAERKDWRGKYERTFERLTETQEDIAKLKGILGYVVCVVETLCHVGPPP